jgi:Na+-driven multidrug efflux pump
MIALPLAYYLGFRSKLGLTGLWLSLPIGFTVLNTSLIVFLKKADWRKIARRAINRINEGKY